MRCYIILLLQKRTTGYKQQRDPNPTRQPLASLKGTLATVHNFVCLYGPCTTFCPITFPVVTFCRSRFSQSLSHPGDPQTKGKNIGSQKKKSLLHPDGATPRKKKDWKKNGRKHVISTKNEFSTASKFSASPVNRTETSMRGTVCRGTNRLVWQINPNCFHALFSGLVFRRYLGKKSLCQKKKVPHAGIELRDRLPHFLKSCASLARVKPNHLFGFLDDRKSTTKKKERSDNRCAWRQGVCRYFQKSEQPLHLHHRHKCTWVLCGFCFFLLLCTDHMYRGM